MYHLKAIDGVMLPIPLQGGPAGSSLDSGHVLRLAGDTVRVDEYRHTPPSGSLPGTVVINLGKWAATQFGNTVVLFPIFAQSQDTAFLGAGDTLTLHTHDSGALQVKVYVAP